MVNIRTITCFADPGAPIDVGRLADLGRVTADTRAAFERAGYAVQTARFASRPFADLVEPAAVVAFAGELEALCLAHAFDYATIGPARPEDPAAAFDAIPEAIGATSAMFASAVIAAGETGVRPQAARRAAAIIHRLACVRGDGFANLHFAALANVPPGVPFLPAAYHAGGPPMLAMGVEAAPLAVAACAGAVSLTEARAALVTAIEQHADRMAAIAERSLAGTPIGFGGLDFSLAPYPDEARSVGTALEHLTGGRVGETGTLAAAAWLADTLDRASFRRAGFSGVFFPVLEDAVLAARASEGLVTVSDLLLWSTVCGTGLDTVPLPGDITEDALAALLTDVGALALRLGKPLTARLMPIPGKRAGDVVRFDFPYFASSSVLALGGHALGGLLGGATTVDYRPRGHH